VKTTAHVSATLWGRIFLPHSLLTTFLLCLLYTNSSHALPYVPDDATFILETLPKTLFSVRNEFSVLRHQVDTNPDDVEISTKLAGAYVSYAKRESDPRYIGYAQALLSKWWHQNPPPEPVHLLRADIKQYNHQFHDAIDDLTMLVKNHPNNSRAWMTLSAIHLLLGNINKATNSCHALARASNNASIALCLSNVLARTGQNNKAEKLLLTLTGHPSILDTELQQWIYTSLAEINIQKGDTVNAEHYFQDALAIDVRNTYLLRLYIDHLTSTGQQAKALGLIKHEKNDTALLIRATLLHRYFNEISHFERNKKILASRFSAEALRGTGIHLREQALFELAVMNNSPKALDLALNNWEIQREPEDARILLYAARAVISKPALIVIKTWIEKIGINDVRLSNKAFGSI